MASPIKFQYSLSDSSRVSSDLSDEEGNNILPPMKKDRDGLEPVPIEYKQQHSTWLQHRTRASCSRVRHQPVSGRSCSRLLVGVMPVLLSWLLPCGENSNNRISLGPDKDNGSNRKQQPATKIDSIFMFYTTVDALRLIELPDITTG